MRRVLQILGAVAVLAVLLVCGVLLVRWLPGSDLLLSSLPAPDENAPSIVVEAKKGAFPIGAAKLFFENSTINQGENPPVKSFLPVFDEADDSAVLVTERDANIVFFAVMDMDRKDTRDLAAGSVPSSWSQHFVVPKLDKGQRPGVWSLSAQNLPSPLYMSVAGKKVLVAQNAQDIDLMLDVKDGKAKGFDKKWSVERKWDSHLYFIDGGLLSNLFDDSENADDSPISLELAWRASGKNAKSDSDKDAASAAGGEMRWSVSGLEKKIDSSFLRSLKPMEWDKLDVFVPDPPLAVVGVNVPRLARKPDTWLYPLRLLGEQVAKLGLKEKDVQGLLSGPLIASLGGRTQVLWFAIPGIAFDLPNRGSLGYKLVDAFWSGLFMGATPTPVEGFSRGGATDLPFTTLAVANDDKVIIGLVDPKVGQNKEVPKLLAKSGKAVGWMMLDLPRLGESLSEMTQVNSLLSDGEEARPIDTEATDSVKDLLQKLGKVFVVWEKDNTGSAIWYH